MAVTLVAEELVKRDKLQEAQFYFTCCLYNSYFFMHQPSWLAQQETHYWRRICVKLKEIWDKHGKEFHEDMPASDRESIWNDTADTSWAMTTMPRDELEDFNTWLHNIVDQDYSEEMDENN